MSEFARRAVLLVAIACATPAAAQNLLANPDFDTDVSGWSTDVAWITGSFDPEDRFDAPDSGSARVVNSWEVDGSNGFFQCVVVPEQDGSVSWDATVWSRVDDGESANGQTMLGLWFFSNQTCSFADPPQTPFDFLVHPLESWSLFAQRGFTMPVGTRSVRFDLRMEKLVEGGSVAGLFDHAYLPEPAALASALAALGTLAALGRR